MNRQFDPFKPMTQNANEILAAVIISVVILWAAWALPQINRANADYKTARDAQYCDIVAPTVHPIDTRKPIEGTTPDNETKR